MKKLFAVVLVVVMLATTIGVVTTALAAAGGNQPGKLAYNLNIIGRPNNYNGSGDDNGSRHTIFIPLKTENYVDPCSTTGGQNKPDADIIPATLPTKGVSLNIVAGDSFSVLDGDATDKSATLQVPYDPATDNPVYNVYALAKGKPDGCLDLEAYNYAGGVLVFLGSVDIDRSRGKPQRINLTNFLYSGNVALFADPYSGYFWQLYNNDLKLMNVRFYEK